MRIFVAVLILSLICNSCTLPIEGYIRNMSGSTVNLYGTIIDRWDFDNLPNIVSFYEVPVDSKSIYGKWKRENLLTWKDSIHFQLQVPDSTAIAVSQLSKELVLGLHFPRVQLILSSKNVNDTLLMGDGSYCYFASKFKHGKGLFSKRTYYYDIQ